MTEDRISGNVLHVFVELAESLRSNHDVVDTMDILVQATVEHTSADQAAVVLADEGGRLHVAASSSERSVEVEEAQIGTNEGPCLECVTTGKLIEVENISASSERWPTFAATALEAGLGAALAIPMPAGGKIIGGMNVFLNKPGRLIEPTVTYIQAMTQVAILSVVQRRETDA